MTAVLGCIADDFTGGTDLAETLSRNGMRTIQLLGVPDTALASEAAAHDHHGVPELHPAVQAGIHGAGDGFSQRGDVHVEAIGHGLELEGFGGEVFGEVVVPAEGHDLVSDLVVGHPAAHGNDRAAALVPEPEGELGVLPEFGGLRRQVAAVEVFIGTADAHEVVLDDDVVLAADEFAFDEFDVAGAVEAGGLGDESIHVRSFMTGRGGDGFDAFPPFPCHASLHGALGAPAAGGRQPGPPVGLDDPGEVQDDRDGRAGDPGHRGAAADSADALPDVHVGHGDGHPEAGRVGVLEHERARV